MEGGGGATDRHTWRRQGWPDESHRHPENGLRALQTDGCRGGGRGKGEGKRTMNNRTEDLELAR